MSPEDAKEMLDAGASLIEIYSGFIYEGPALIKKIIKYLERFGHSGEIVPVTEGLHLKTGVSWLGSNRLLLTKAMARQKAFAAFEHIVVAPEEAAAANCLWIDGKVIMPDGYPSTARALQNAGHHIIKVDISEYEKLDGGLSCLSLRF